MKRRKARELALQFLFQWDVSGEGNLDTRLALFWEWQRPHSEAQQYAERLIRGTLDRLREIDGLLAQASEHWTLDRMATVDRNILRCAIYEILFCEEVPEKVAIDEAIEVAKKYGSAESPAFVNGVLDQILKQGKRKAAAASL